MDSKVMLDNKFMWRFIGLRRRYAINRSWGDGIAEALYWAYRGKCFPMLLTHEFIDEKMGEQK